MLSRFFAYLKSRISLVFTPVDPEIVAINRELQALDDYLKIQNLRREEEIRFLKLRYGQDCRSIR
jgi:LytS/YehU family sensor histidine kinase